MEKKMQTPIDTLCRGLPPEFNQYITYCRNLKFEERPDYSYLRQQFANVMQKQGFTYDYQYDWVGPSSQQPQHNSSVNKPQENENAPII